MKKMPMSCKNCEAKDILIEALTEQVNDKDDEISELTAGIEEFESADEED